MLRTFTRSSRTLRTASVRPFSQSAVQRVEGYPNNASTNSKTDTSMLPDDEHSVNKAKKGDKNDIQTSNLSDGLEYVSLCRLACSHDLFQLTSPQQGKARRRWPRDRGQGLCRRKGEGEAGVPRGTRPSYRHAGRARWPWCVMKKKGIRTKPIVKDQGVYYQH
jgi:hypothetical protein